MQSEIDGPSEIDLLKQYISKLKAENNKIKAENVELKVRVAKLEDKQSQNELIKNLLSVSRKHDHSGEKVSQLSDSVAFFKSIIPDTKKAIVSAEKSIDLLENRCQNLEDIISVKDRKIITLVDQILSKTKHNDVTIEPEIYSSTHERKLWAKRHSESEHDLETQKKYTFHP
ncbi:hypothetical protein C1645_816714 [Glomus cerebriforme]|uniref:Uncharacterized protein n=1 Tax=Glomus cerebriforme TaxID=658196 RepID=A0A397TKU5_9GLOM|nr:hypothetical protein C1645_816714 [Glomus cerebriforme]